MPPSPPAGRISFLHGDQGDALNTTTVKITSTTSGVASSFSIPESSSARKNSSVVLESSSSATKISSVGPERSTPSLKSTSVAPNTSLSSSERIPSGSKSTSPTSLGTTHDTKKSSLSPGSSTTHTATIPSTTKKSPSPVLGSTTHGAGSSSPTVEGPSRSMTSSPPDLKTTNVSMGSAPPDRASSSHVTEIPPPSSTSSDGKVISSPVVDVAPTSAPMTSKPTVPGTTLTAGIHLEKDPAARPTLNTTLLEITSGGSKELKKAETTRGTSATTVGRSGGDKKDATVKKSDSPLPPTISVFGAATSTPANTERVSEPMSTFKPHDSQQIACKEQIPLFETEKKTPKLVTLKATGICGAVEQTKQSEELYSIICKALKPTFNQSQDRCIVSLAPIQGSSNHYALVDASVLINPGQEELFELLREKKDEFKKARITDVMLADKQLGDDEPTDRFSTPLITTIVCLAVALLLTAAIYSCCRQRRSCRKDQRESERRQA
uniref:Podocalyxin n=1 Tax=Crocodylus porosus TaxID=8502 RepID=A0A7M4DZY3_CROPO